MRYVDAIIDEVWDRTCEGDDVVGKQGPFVWGGEERSFAVRNPGCHLRCSREDVVNEDVKKDGGEWASLPDAAFEGKRRCVGCRWSVAYTYSELGGSVECLDEGEASAIDAEVFKRAEEGFMWDSVVGLPKVNEE